MLPPSEGLGWMAAGHSGAAITIVSGRRLADYEYEFWTGLAHIFLPSIEAGLSDMTSRLCPTRRWITRRLTSQSLASEAEVRNHFCRLVNWGGWCCVPLYRRPDCSRRLRVFSLRDKYLPTRRSHVLPNCRRSRCASFMR